METDDRGKDSDTESLAADRVIAAVPETGKGFAGLLKHFRNVRNGPFLISEGRLKEGLRLIATSHLESFPQNITEKVDRDMYERAKDPAHVGRLFEAEAQNLIEVALGQLGTHTSKIPNTQNGGPGALYRDDEVFQIASSTSGYLSSATLEQRVLSLGGAGNAAKGRSQRLLATKIRMGDEVFDLADDLEAKGRVYAAFLELGYPVDALDELVDALNAGKNGGRDLSLGGNTKCLIWPTDDGDVVLSPVHPFSMHVEMHTRLKKRRADRNVIIDTSFVVIGGDKPQNGGLVNNDIGGNHPLLVSLPPKVLRGKERVAYRAASTGTLGFHSVPRRHPVATKLRNLMDSSSNNDVVRKAMRRHVNLLVHLALRHHFSLLETLAADEEGSRARAMAESALKGVRASVRTVIESGYDDSVEEHRAFAQELADEAMRPFEEGDALRSVFVDVARDVCARRLKGVARYVA